MPEIQFIKLNANDPEAFMKIKEKAKECVNIGAPDGVCSSDRKIDEIRNTLKLKKTLSAKKVIEVAKEKTGCDDSEVCALKKLNLDVEVYRFNQPGPATTTEWLSNIDIDKTLEKYMLQFKPHYLHIEFEMRDFLTSNKPEGVLRLRDVNWADFLQRYKYLSCALNTDLSSRTGEHWTSFFVDKPGKTVEYFDSAAGDIHQEFIELVNNVVKNLRQLSNDDSWKGVMVTNVEHQTENTECGVYTLYYILSRLHGVKYTAFMDGCNTIDDDMMEEFRSSIFLKNS